MILELEDISFAYAGGKPLYSGVCLAIPQGGFVLVRGPSGAGKSTLLRLLNQLEAPSKGRLRYKGKLYDDYAGPKLRREISYLQQTPVVLDASVLDNLLLPFTFAANSDLPRPTTAELRAGMDTFLLDTVKLEDNALHCSVGQRQRVCLLRAMLLKPAVLLLDEPTSALDLENRTIVEDVAETLNREQGITIIMVNHNEYEPRTVAPHVVDVRNGTARMIAPVKEMV